MQELERTGANHTTVEHSWKFPVVVKGQTKQNHSSKFPMSFHFSSANGKKKKNDGFDMTNSDWQWGAESSLETGQEIEFGVFPPTTPSKKPTSKPEPQN